MTYIIPTLPCEYSCPSGTDSTDEHTCHGGISCVGESDPDDKDATLEDVLPCDDELIWCHTDIVTRKNT